MIERTIFNEDHALFRDTVRRFLDEHAKPHHEKWEAQGYVDRDVWLKAGQQGLLLPSIPAEYGGGGADEAMSAVLIEEVARANTSGLGFGLHNDIVAPYINHYGSETLKKKFLPAMARGEKIGAIAMTEPAAGSDLQGVRTTARKDGDHYVINGSKTFITNGWHADVVIVVCKTDPNAGAKGTSLIIVETGTPGFRKGKRLKKVGLKSQDTSELFFDDVRVPAENLLGKEGEGFIYLMQQLPWERLQIAITAHASAQAAIDHTVQYAQDRKAFGAPIGEFQNTRYKLAECQTEVEVGRVFVDRCLEMMIAGTLDPATASMAKLWLSEMQGRVLDECVQLHGGYGFMWEFPVAQAYADARVQRIYGGTSEIMKELISRQMGLGGPGRKKK
jgi:alkylation response protein AidB-like acyl-CoA dehydrogenase